MASSSGTGNVMKSVGLALPTFEWRPLAAARPRRPVADEDPPSLRPAQAGYGLEQVMAEAEQIIGEAQAEAERLKAEALSQIEQLRHALYEEALVQARRDVAAELASSGSQADDLSRAQQLIAAGLQEVRAHYDQALEELEQRAFEIAWVVARRVIGDELSARPELVLQSVREAVSLAGGGELAVHVNPADLPYLQPALIELQKSRANGEFITFEEDASVERGGCRVVGPSGEVDSQPSSKLAQLEGVAL